MDGKERDGRESRDARLPFLCCWWAEVVGRILITLDAPADY